MINRFVFSVAFVAIMLTGCAPATTMTDAQRCQDLGHEEGSEAFERCLKEEQALRQMQEFEERQEEQAVRDRQHKLIPQQFK